MWSRSYPLGPKVGTALFHTPVTAFPGPGSSHGTRQMVIFHHFLISPLISAWPRDLVALPPSLSLGVPHPSNYDISLGKSHFGGALTIGFIGHFSANADTGSEPVRMNRRGSSLGKPVLASYGLPASRGRSRLPSALGTVLWHGGMEGSSVSGHGLSVLKALSGGVCMNSSEV